jgi:hypothetical protein
MVYELCRTVVRKSGTRGFDVRRARHELAQAIEFPVDPLESGDKDLLALQWLPQRTSNLIHRGALALLSWQSYSAILEDVGPQQGPTRAPGTPVPQCLPAGS